MFEDLKQLVADGYIMEKKHDIYDIFIYDYLPLTTYSRKWNETTITCRGVVLDKDYNFIARTFPKFFNYEELLAVGETIPDEPFTVTEKLDGSFGIVFKYNNEWMVNTRGSFNSDQAIWGKQWLDKNLEMECIPDGYTYLFEIIYPQNRIVVDYKGKEEMVLIGVVENSTGYIFPYDELGVVASIMKAELVNKYEFETFEDMFTKRETLTANEEGFVVSYNNGFKFKLKGDEYCKIHKMVSYLTPLSFWEAFDFNTMSIPILYLQAFPEECRERVDELVEQTNNIFIEPIEYIQSLIKDIPFFPDTNDGKKDRYMYLLDKYGKWITGAMLNIINCNMHGIELQLRRINKPRRNFYVENLIEKLKNKLL